MSSSYRFYNSLLLSGRRPLLRSSFHFSTSDPERDVGREGWIFIFASSISFQCFFFFSIGGKFEVEGLKTLSMSVSDTRILQSSSHHILFLLFHLTFGIRSLSSNLDWSHGDNRTPRPFPRGSTFNHSVMHWTFRTSRHDECIWEKDPQQKNSQSISIRHPKQSVILYEILSNI